MPTEGRTLCCPPQILVQWRAQSKAFSEGWLCLHGSESPTAGWPAWARAQPPGCKILGSRRLRPACGTVHQRSPSDGRRSWAGTAPRSIAPAVGAFLPGRTQMGWGLPPPWLRPSCPPISPLPGSPSDKRLRREPHCWHLSLGHRGPAAAERSPDLLPRRRKLRQ